MSVAVVFVAGTAIRGVGARLLMHSVMERHPNAFLVTLERWGITIPLDESQSFLVERVRAGLDAQGRDPDSPVVLVGHSQGGLAVLRYAIDHPQQVERVVTVGTPWSGAPLAGRVTDLTRRLTGRDLPALRDMRPGSPFLLGLWEDIGPIADRVTNIYSTHEVLISPYVNAHIDVPGVTNVLIASEAEYESHLRVHRDRFSVDVLLNARVGHLREMNSPLVRSVIWQLVDEVDRLRGGR
ncbi:MAG TPA: alpha/beta fold hydrolase [Dermatophilaceae bacterium]